MGSVKALEVALSDGTGCLAELEVQTITYLLSPPSLQRLHPHCVGTALPGRMVPEEISAQCHTDTHWGYFPLKPTLGFKYPEDTDSWAQTSHVLGVGAELNDPHQPRGPFPEGCPLDAPSPAQRAARLPHWGAALWCQSSGEMDGSRWAIKAQIISEIRYTSPHLLCGWQRSHKPMFTFSPCSTR